MSYAMSSELWANKPRGFAHGSPLVARRLLMNALETPPQKRAQIVRVHVFIRCLAGRVVSAGEHSDFVINAVRLELLDYLAREFWQERQIVGRVDDQRFTLEARKLIEV